ncbi:MAG: Valyl-tRNA synthetase, partial [uncultured Nocardioidaceae bacterium]
DRDPLHRPVHGGAHVRRRRTGQAGAGGAGGEVVDVLEGAGDLRLRPVADARRDLLDRHSPADRLRVAARGACLLLHPHRPRRAPSAHARQGGVLPDGVGRQRAAHRASGAELLRRPLRPLAALRPRLRPAGEAGPQAPDPDQPPQLHRALRAAGPGGREGLRVAVAHPRAVRGLEADLHDHRHRVPDRLPTRVPAELRARRGLPAGGSHPLGRDVPDRGGTGGARGAGVRRRLPPGGVPPDPLGRQARGRAGPAGVHRDHASRAHPRRGGAGGAPGRRALPAAVRHDRHLAGLRRRDPRARARGGRAGQGRRRRDVLHLRRPHRRAVVARARPARPHRDRPRRQAPPRDAGVAAPARGSRGGRHGVRRAGRQDHLQRTGGDGRSPAGLRRPRRRADHHPADGQLLREGRQAARDRLDPSVVHHQRRQGRRPARRARRAGRRDRVEPAAHAAPLRQLGRRAQRRLAGLTSAVLRHPLPGLVPPRRRRRARPRPPPAADRGGAPGRPLDRRAARLRRGPAREARGLHGRPRRHGHLGDLVADPAHRGRVGERRGPVPPCVPDGPLHARPRHHQDLAVLPRRPLALREPRRAVVACPDLGVRRRPRPQEDEQVQGQRRGADRDPRHLRRRRGPVARRDGPSGARLAVRRDPDEGRPPAGDEGAERLEVRPGRSRRHLGGARGRDRAGGPGDARRSRDGGAAGHRGVRRLRLHDGPRGDRALLLGLLRRLRRAGQGAGVRRTGRRSRGLGEVGPRAGAPRPAPVARAVPPLRDRGGVVVVAARLRSPAAVADPGRAREHRRWAARDDRRRRDRAGRAPRGEVQCQGVHAHRAVLGDRHGPPGGPRGAAAGGRRPGRRREGRRRGVVRGAPRRRAHRRGRAGPASGL